MVEFVPEHMVGDLEESLLGIGWRYDREDEFTASLPVREALIGIDDLVDDTYGVGQDLARMILSEVVVGSAYLLVNSAIDAPDVLECFDESELAEIEGRSHLRKIYSWIKQENIHFYRFAQRWSKRSGRISDGMQLACSLYLTLDQAYDAVGLNLADE